LIFLNKSIDLKQSLIRQHIHNKLTHLDTKMYREKSKEKNLSDKT